MPLSRESAYKKETGPQVLLGFPSTGPALHQSASSCSADSLRPLLGLPDASVAFDRAQFGLGVRGQGAPGGLRAQPQGRAGGRPRGAHVARDPEGPDAAVHPLLQRATQQLGSTASLQHGGLLRRQLQHGAELLHALLQVHVSRWASVEPNVLCCEGKQRKGKESKLLYLQHFVFCFVFYRLPTSHLYAAAPYL